MKPEKSYGPRVDPSRTLTPNVHIHQFHPYHGHTADPKHTDVDHAGHAQFQHQHHHHEHGTHTQQGERVEHDHQPKATTHDQKTVEAVTGTAAPATAPVTAPVTTEMQPTSAMTSAQPTSAVNHPKAGGLAPALPMPTPTTHSGTFSLGISSYTNSSRL